MSRSSVKRLFAVLLSCTLAGQPLLVSANQVLKWETGENKAAELEVRFDQEYAQVGKAIRVIVEGADSTSCTYTWKRDGVVIANQSDIYTPVRDDIEKMIQVTVSDESGKSASVSMLVSKLPVIYIDTENSQPITSKDYYIGATMHIQGNEIYNSSNGGSFDGEIEIKGRGNSTWNEPKKPYKLKLGEKSDLFQMGESKHWVLLANYTDNSLMRNTLAYDLSGEMGMYQMQTTWVDVVLNGEKVGNYQFCEQIRIADDRVAIDNWEDVSKDVAKAIAKKEGISKDDRDSLEDALNEDMGWITSDQVEFQGNQYTVSRYYEVPDIDGGYLLELDEYLDEESVFQTRHDQPIMFHTPEFARTNQEMMSYVKDYLQAFEDAVYNENDFTAAYEGECRHYSELFDMDALVDYWLIQELFFNEDGMKKSTYLYKDHGDLFHMGPVWDMDWSANGQGDTKWYDKWQTKYFQAKWQKQQWYTQLIKDPYFLMKAQQRYQEIRGLLGDIVKKDGKIDEYTSYLKESADLNDQVWYGSGRFTANAQGLKTWMSRRIDWLDQQFRTKDSLFASMGTYAEDEMQMRLSDEKGNELRHDETVDGYLPAAFDLQVRVQGNADHIEIYVNGIKQTEADYGQGSAKAVVPFESLKDTNILEIRSVDQKGAVMASSMRTVCISEPVVCDMVITVPSKTEYLAGEELDLTGFRAELLRSDDSRVDVSEEVEITGFANDISGTVTVSVQYQNFTKTFEVTIVVDKTKLAELLEQVKTYESGDYTQDTWDGLQKAAGEAERIYASEKVSQDAVDLAVKDLQSAIEELEKAEEPKTEADLTGLCQAVAKAKALHEADFTSESWSVVVKALADAEKMNKDSAQADVDAAAEALNNAINALVRVIGDFTITNGDKTITVSGIKDGAVKLISKEYDADKVKEIQKKFAQNQLLKGMKIENLYDLYLMKDNVIVQPDGVVAVRIQVDEALIAKGLKVYEIDGDKIRQITVKKGTNYIEFDTDHMSMYAIASKDKAGAEKPAPNQVKDGVKTGDTSSTAMMVTLLLLSGTLGLALQKKKRSQR